MDAICVGEMLIDFTPGSEPGVHKEMPAAPQPMPVLPWPETVWMWAS